jgi:hypothetical protein
MFFPTIPIDTCTSPPPQMCRLDLPFHFDLAKTFIPSNIVATGIVSILDIADKSFSISLTHNITIDMPTGVLTVHTVTYSNVVWPPHIQPD